MFLLIVLLLVLFVYQAMTVMVRDFKRHAITEEELKVLLTFVEEDVEDYRRQSTAFPLLKVWERRGGGGINNVLCYSGHSESETGGRRDLRCHAESGQFVPDF